MTRMDKIKDFFLHWAEIIDAWRVAPRAVLAFYAYMILKTSLWFMDLESPTPEQSAFVMAIWGTAALIFNFYAKSGRAWGPQIEWTNVGKNDFLAGQRDRYYGGNQRRSRSRYRDRSTKRNRNEEPDQEEEDG